MKYPSPLLTGASRQSQVFRFDLLLNSPVRLELKKMFTLAWPRLTISKSLKYADRLVGWQGWELGGERGDRLDTEMSDN